MLVIVNDSPLRSHSSMAALRFCRAALTRGHVIAQVFFYLDGVYHQLDAGTQEAGESDLVAEWQILADRHRTKLVVCTAASHRRIPAGDSVIAGFHPGSLVETLGLSTRIDRTISFGGP